MNGYQSTQPRTDPTEERRKLLRESIPAIDRLESLDSLKNLRLISLTPGPFMVLGYEATATHELYKQVGVGLINAAVIVREQIIYMATHNKGLPDEFKLFHLELTLYEQSSRGEMPVEVKLKVYNPNYQTP